MNIFDKHDEELENQTPIEVMLGIDSKHMTTARKLYEFLGLDVGNYARWVKSNIVNNKFAEEGIDYYAFTINKERGGQASVDYRLSASFAKKLAMTSHTERGEQARKYFVKVEEILKEKALEEKRRLPSNYKQALQALIDQLDENEKLEEDNSRLEVELDCSKQWYTIKRVAKINDIEWSKLEWRKLKDKSYDLGYGINKVFDANYGWVNSYNLVVWKTVYPKLKFN